MIGNRIIGEEFNEIKFRLFKKYGKNTGGNSLFIKSSNEFNEIFKTNKGLIDEYIFIFQTIDDKEYLYCDNFENVKFYFNNYKPKENECVNLFNKSLSWVITFFNKNMV